METNELEYLISLFDDPDSVVREAVDRRLASAGREVLPSLRSAMRRERDPLLKESIGKRLDSLSARFALEDFRTYLGRDYQDITEASGIIISMIRGDGFDLRKFHSDISLMAAAMPDVADDSRTAMERTRLFNDGFFHTLGFHVQDILMTDPGMMLLDDVASTRKGNQVTVSLLYFILARTTGLDIYPLSFPGGFVPVYRENGKRLFFVNSFHGGEVFSAHRLKDVLNNAGYAFSADSFIDRDDNFLVSFYLELLLHCPAAGAFAASRPLLEKALKMAGGIGIPESGAADEEDW